MNNFKNKYIGDKEFYSRVQKIAIPVLLQSLLTVAAQLVDNIMVGRLGSNSIASVTSANQLFFVTMVTIFGVSAGGQIYISQFNGSEDYKNTKKSFHITIVLALLAGLLAFTIISLFSNKLLLVYIEDLEVLDYAHSYLKYIALSIFPFAISVSFSTGFRSITKTKIPMYVGFVTVLTNTFFNYLFIFGFANIPALGVEGAGIATLTARLVEVSLYIMISFKIDSPIKATIKDLFDLDFSLFKKIATKSFPLVTNEFFWSLSQSLLIAIYAKQVADNISSFQIASTFANIFFNIMGALGAAVAVILGTSLGKSELSKAKDEANKLTGFSFVVGIVCGFILFTLSFIVPYLFKVDYDIMALSQQIIRFMALMFPIYYITVTYFFTLRSGGDSKSVLIMDSGFSWVVYIPVALLSRYVFGLSMLSTIIVVELLNYLKAYIGFRAVKKGNWLNNLTK